MANSWLRLWHDMPNDPKFKTIARSSGQPIALVLSVYMHLLVAASQNVERGRADVTTEDLASALDVADDQIDAILRAMQGRVLRDRKLSGWENRQPKREERANPNSKAKMPAERKREQRARDRMRAEIEARAPSQNVTENVTGHEKSRNVTIESVTKRDILSTQPVEYDDNRRAQAIDLKDMSRNVTHSHTMSRTDKDTDTDKDIKNSVCGAHVPARESDQNSIINENTEAATLADAMVKSLIDENPKFIIRDRDRWIAGVAQMLAEGRDSQTIIRNWLWAIRSPNASPYVLTPSDLAKQFDRISKKIESASRSRPPRSARSGSVIPEGARLTRDLTIREQLTDRGWADVH